MQRLFKAFHDAGQELFLVGGAVRDIALGASDNELDDLDFATNARPENTRDILRKNAFRTYDMGFEFGTVGATLKGPKNEGFPKDVQITTYRSSEYYRRGSRHPVVSFGDTLEQDLKRRDFSINSIAMDSDRNYVDPHKGLDDIKTRTLRIVGDSDATLAEDPLRILRVGRFIAKLGFTPTTRLERAAYHQAPYILDISRQRWLQEMNKLVVGPYVPQALGFLARVRLLGIILPELVNLFELHLRCPAGPVHDDFWTTTLNRVEQAAKSKDHILSWSALLADTGRPWTRTVTVDTKEPTGPELVGLSRDAFPQQAQPDAPRATFTRHNLLASLFFKGLTRRFQFDNETADAVLFLLEHQGRTLDYRNAWSDAQIRELVRDSQPYYIRLIALDRCIQQSEGRSPEADLDMLETRIEALSKAGKLVPNLPKGLGKHLINDLSIAPGPLLSEVIAWLNEEIIAGRLDSNEEPSVYVQHLTTTQPTILLEAQQSAGPSRYSKPKILKN